MRDMKRNNEFVWRYDLENEEFVYKIISMAQPVHLWDGMNLSYEELLHDNPHRAYVIAIEYRTLMIVDRFKSLIFPATSPKTARIFGRSDHGEEEASKFRLLLSYASTNFQRLKLSQFVRWNPFRGQFGSLLPHLFGPVDPFLSQLLALLLPVDSLAMLQ